jgi:hypothetical protein
VRNASQINNEGDPDRNAGKYFAEAKAHGIHTDMSHHKNTASLMIDFHWCGPCRRMAPDISLPIQPQIDEAKVQSIASLHRNIC